MAKSIKQHAEELGYVTKLVKQDHESTLKFGLNIELLKNDFGWQPQYDLNDTIRSLFNYLKK